jgi:hypothetical protein
MAFTSADEGRAVLRVEVSDAASMLSIYLKWQQEDLGPPQHEPAGHMAVGQASANNLLAQQSPAGWKGVC